MKKFNAARRRGARKQAQSRWQGVAKILKLCARAEHTLNVEPVVDSFHAVDLLISIKSI
jgi:hypothetical protein|tara:strand:+ start:72 stop:248 length:177 start_codon:yes stop_codon:yes gene_type:complete